jgi:hypothetical protein
LFSISPTVLLKKVKVQRGVGKAYSRDGGAKTNGGKKGKQPEH